MQLATRTIHLAMPLDVELSEASAESGSPTLRHVDMDTIVEDPDRVRTLRQNADVVALAESIRANGLLHPLLVERLPHGDRFRLIAGHRRLAALRRLRADSVPVLVLDPKNDLHRLSMQIVENVRRRALTPSDRRDAYLRLREFAHGSTCKAASMLGIHPASFRRAVREGEASHARAVVRLSLGQTLKSLERWSAAAPHMPREKQQQLLEKAEMLVSELQKSLRSEIGTDDVDLLAYPVRTSLPAAG